MEVALAPQHIPTLGKKQTLSRPHLENPFSTQAFAEFFEEITTKFKSLAIGFLSPKLTDWKSDSYVQEAATNFEAATARWLAELMTYFDEKAKIADTTRNNLIHRQYSWSINGMVSSQTNQPLYAESTAAQMAKFAQMRIDSADEVVVRPILEAHVAQTIEAWMLDPNLSHKQKLVWFSPPGEIKEGYAGTKKDNYSLVNVLEVEIEDGNAPTFTLTQYLSYDTVKQLDELQKLITKNLGGEIYRLHQNPHLNQLDFPTIDQPAHQIISRLISIPDQTDFWEYFETQLAANNQEWHFKPTDFPQMDFDWYLQTREDLLDYSAQIFTELIQTVPPQVAIEHLDSLVQISKKFLFKWLENNALNYQFQDGTVATPTQMLQAIDFEELELAWKKMIKAPLAKEEQQKAKLIMKDLKPTVNVFKEIISVTDCVVGTPGSVAFKAAQLNNLNIATNSLKIPNFTETQLLNFKKTTYVQIDLAGQTWFVPIEYGTDIKKDYSVKDGVVYGPCGIPLAKDPLALTSEEYVQYLMAIQQQENEAASKEIAAKTLQKIKPEQTEKFNQLWEKLLKLISPTTLGFSDLIANLMSANFWEMALNQAQLLQTIKTKLKNSSDPLAELQKIIDQLSPHQSAPVAI